MFDELKKLLKHTAVYGVGNILSKAIGFLMIPLYTHYLTPEDYGVLELLDLTVSLVGLMVGLGIGAAILRYYYQYESEQDKKEVISTSLIFVICVSFFVLVASFIFSKNISNSIFNKEIYDTYFKLIFIQFFFSTIASVPETYLLAKQKSALYTTISIITLALNLSFNILFVAFLKMGVIGILYSSVIIRFLNCSFLSIMTFPKLKLSFNFVKFKEMLKYGIPLIPANFGQFALSFSDRFFINYLCPLSVLGLYSLGYKFAIMLFFLIIQPFNLIWQAKMFEIAKKPNADQIFSRLLTYFNFVIIFAALSLSILIKEIIKLIADPSFYDAYKFVPIIAFGYVMRGSYSFFQVGIYLKKKTRYLGYAVGSAALVNLILNYILISKYDAMGAAWATVISFFYMVLITYIFSQKLYHISYEFSRISKMFLIAIVMFILSNFVETDFIIKAIFFKSALILAYPIILFIFNFFTPEETLKIKTIAKSVALKLVFQNR